MNINTILCLTSMCSVIAIETGYVPLAEILERFFGEINFGIQG